MKRLDVCSGSMFNPNPGFGKYMLNRFSPALCSADNDDTHPEDNDYNGGGNPHGW